VTKRVVIRELPTGVPGLDEVLGGGIPEFAFNLIAGSPGSGKTTLAQQIMFANATPERPGIFFTVLGEPPIKMLRYQQQFSFFDIDRVGHDVHFMNLSEEVLERNLDLVLERISSEVARLNPSVVVVDSFRTVVTSLDRAGSSELEMQHFIQRLALRLTSWETTSFLIGEFARHDSHAPVFTVADGVIWIYNEVEQNTSVRKLRATKLRGKALLPGLHTLRISELGVEVFPRRLKPPTLLVPRERTERVSTGIVALDEMMLGGIPRGDSCLLSGPTGTGKTIISQHFAAAGVERDERVVIGVFEEHPEMYLARAKSLGMDFDRHMAEGKLEVMYLPQIDLSVDETLQEIRTRVTRLNATRVVLDSISGFESSLAPSYRADFRESFHRLVVSLSSLGVTTMSTVETFGQAEYLRYSPFNVSFLTDDIISLRYEEVDGTLLKVMTIIKMRGSGHSREIRAFDITDRGVVLGSNLRDLKAGSQ
jgi:circadian clock protein KaiC